MTKLLTIAGAWYVDTLPGRIVVETTGGELMSFDLMPYRTITLPDMLPYDGLHPRRLRGQPLPDYLYANYGLERSQESLSEVIHVRISPSEQAALTAAAKNKNRTVSEFVRDYIRSLRKP